MTKDIDVSRIDVGWRVRLDATTFNDGCKKLHGVWATVSSLQEYGLYVVDDLEGWNRYIDKDPRGFLAALPPEPAKDPFAVGEWVVCVDSDYDVVKGALVQVSAIHRGDPVNWFVGGRKWGYKKSNFRPATPEEIAAHLEKTATQGCEPKAEPAAPIDTDAQGDGKITFTAAGREFFVGQRVWANTIGAAGLGKLIDVPHEVTGCVAMSELVCIREMDGFNQRVIASLCLSEVPLHNWQFGDQASHPKHGKVLVIDMTEPESFQCASPSDPEIFIDPAELTFIRRTDLGE